MLKRFTVASLQASTLGTRAWRVEEDGVGQGWPWQHHKWTIGEQSGYRSWWYVGTVPSTVLKAKINFKWNCTNNVQLTTHSLRTAACNICFSFLVIYSFVLIHARSNHPFQSLMSSQFQRWSIIVHDRQPCNVCWRRLVNIWAVIGIFFLDESKSGWQAEWSKMVFSI